MGSAAHSTFISIRNTLVKSSRLKTERTAIPRSTSWFHSLPFQRSQVLLTLFSKFFSSFPQGTCFLSVPRLYLAVGEIYHHVNASSSRSATLRKQTVYAKSAGGPRDFHPLWIPFPRVLHLLKRWSCFWRLQFWIRRLRFPSWASPCSFAITEGILFSFYSSAYLYA